MLIEFLKSLLDRWDERVEKAGGDPIEAIHGHVCGFECWHAMGWPLVCFRCVKPAEERRFAGRFGDFSVCSRCKKSVTSNDEAFRVKPDRMQAKAP